MRVRVRVRVRVRPRVSGLGLGVVVATWSGAMPNLVRMAESTRRELTLRPTSAEVMPMARKKSTTAASSSISAATDFSPG